MDEDDGLNLHTYREQHSHLAQFQQPHNKLIKTSKFTENSKMFKPNGGNHNSANMNTGNSNVFANNIIWSNQCLTSSRSTSPSSMISPSSTSSAITSSSSSLRTSTSNSIVTNTNRHQIANQANKLNATNRNNSLNDHGQHLSQSNGFNKRVNSKSNSITVDDDFSGCFEDDAFEDSYPDEDDDADVANSRCNLSKLKMKQEECQFNNLLSECKRWIEVSFDFFLFINKNKLDFVSL